MGTGQSVSVAQDNLKILSIQKITPGGVDISARGAHTLVSVGRKLLVLGGEALADNSTKFAQYDTDDKSWSLLPTETSTISDLLSYHSAIVNDAQTSMLVFGGYSYQSRKRYKELLEYNIAKRIWRSVPYGFKSEELSSRLIEISAHSAVNIRNAQGEECMIVYGGYTGQSFSPLMVEFNMRTKLWRELPNNNKASVNPPSRSSSVFVYDKKRNRIVMGGGSKEEGERGVFYAYQLDSERWVSLPCKSAARNGKIPSNRYGAAACISGDHLYLFGGCRYKGFKYLKGFFRMNLDSHEWEKIVFPKGQEELVPQARHFATFAAVNSASHSKLYLYGGLLSNKVGDQAAGNLFEIIINESFKFPRMHDILKRRQLSDCTVILRC